jgi:diaminopropionate ammonia-lyase
MRTILAGLACRQVSPAAWTILEGLTSDYLRIPDDWAAEGMRSRADGNGDFAIVRGESGGGAMGVLRESVRDEALRAALGLDASSQVLIFGCEGTTEAEISEKIVGSRPVR